MTVGNIVNALSQRLHRLGAVACAAAGLASVLGVAPVSAQEIRSPVVVELFTSQGCSSCPPADALLHDLAKRDDVVALALHVDYWDYIGWKDEFALPGHAARQKAYARVAGRSSVYTPQMIINGTDQVVGTHAMDVTDLIAIHRAREAPVRIDTQSAEGQVTISASAPAPLDAGVTITVVSYLPDARVKVTRGENAGHTLAYTNIVRGWTTLGEWTGKEPFTTTIERPALPAVVLVQEAGNGPILGARKLDR